MILNCEPLEVMKYFEEICSIPHGSGNTKAISDYLMNFALEHDIDAVQDDLNNVIMWKEATPDKKESEPVILQGHMDMVCVKEDWCGKNLQEEGLDLEMDGGFISAKGTSLGGDDGIAVAYSLAILASNVISHPDIAAVFTVDEEIGMLGAAGIDLSDVKGRLMLNMDSEDEGVFLVGCAGGATADCLIPVGFEEVEGVGHKVSFSGLSGGHSGVEIDRGRANANEMFGRLMLELSEETPFYLAKLSGGEKDNAIANSLSFLAVVPDEFVGEFGRKIKEFEGKMIKEYSGVEKNIKITVNQLEKNKYHVVDKKGTEKIMMALNYIPNGVQKMSVHIKGLVRTSLNLGIINLSDGSFRMKYSVRSSVKTEKDNLILKIKKFVEFLGGEVQVTGEYPAWEYREDSKLRNLMVESYRRLFGGEAKLETIHAGVECGIMASKIPDLDCVSFGPQMYDIHTTKERLDIKSVERTWKLILDVLKNV